MQVSRPVKGFIFNIYMVEDLINYLKSKGIVESETYAKTGSVYLKTTNDLKLRISDHLPSKEKGYASKHLNIVVLHGSNDFIVILNRKLFVYKSMDSLCSFIIDFDRINGSIISELKNDIQSTNELNATIENLKKTIKAKDVELKNGKVAIARQHANISKLKSQLGQKEEILRNELQKEYNSATKKLVQVKLQLNGLTKEVAELKLEVSKKDSHCKTLQKELDTAVELMDDLIQNPEARAYITNSQGKVYYIDNFSQDAAEMLEYIIKNYYSK